MRTHGAQPADSGKFVDDRHRTEGMEDSSTGARPMQSAATGEPADWPGSGVSVPPRPSSDLCPSLCTRVPASDQPLSVGAVTPEGSNGAVPRNDLAPPRERNRRKETRGRGGETDRERNDRLKKWKESGAKRETEGERKRERIKKYNWEIDDRSKKHRQDRRRFGNMGFPLDR